MVQAAHLVHLPVLPVRDAGAGGGGGAHQGAAARHDLVHLQDPLLAVHVMCSFIHVKKKKDDDSGTGRADQDDLFLLLCKSGCEPVTADR